MNYLDEIRDAFDVIDRGNQDINRQLEIAGIPANGDLFEVGGEVFVALEASSRIFAGRRGGRHNLAITSVPYARLPALIDEVKAHLRKAAKR